MKGIGSFARARVAKDDEYYTRFRDVETELGNYAEFFAGKTVFCNCDDPDWSAFFRYFVESFHHLGLGSLISTHYEPRGKSYMLSYDGVENPKKFLRRLKMGGNFPGYKRDLKENGDFRSAECIELLEKSDIVVTNPPFSLFREYFDQLMEYKKKFLILGNFNAVGFKNVWPLFKKGEVWIGVDKNRSKEFGVPKLGKIPPANVRVDGDKWYKTCNVAWYTNLPHSGRTNEYIPLVRRWSRDKDRYVKYDNCDAIEVSNVSDIPDGYDGRMGVPLTFIMKHNPKQFHIHEMAFTPADPDFVPDKVYKDPICVGKEKESVSKAANQFPVIAHDTQPPGVSYRVGKKYLTIPYRRILISHNHKGENHETRTP